MFIGFTGNRIPDWFGPGVGETTGKTFSFHVLI